MRVENSLKNSGIGLIQSCLSIVVSFVSRSIFIYFLDVNYLGINGLFTNVLLLFSLVELGIGGALQQMLFKPFAHKDFNKASVFASLMIKLFNLIGILIFIIGLSFIPFLNLIVDDINIVPNLTHIFLLYTVSTAATYMVGAYRVIIAADQKSYQLFKIDIATTVALFCSQTAVLWITKNFELYLISKIITTLVQNIIIKNKVKKQYELINYKSTIKFEGGEKEEIIKNIFSLSLYRLAMVITDGTDNIIISKMFNIAAVGIVSNYILVVKSVLGLVESLFSPLLSSVGNLCALESIERKKKTFDELSFVNFWVYSLVSICTFILIDPFIKLWVGEQYILSQLVSLFLCLDMFASGLLRTVSLFRTAEGLFWYGKLRPLAQAILNVILSVVFVNLTGEIWSVFAGTIMSKVLTTFWYDPYIVFKYSFNKSPKEFYLRYIFYFIFGIATGGLVFYISSKLYTNLIIELILKLVLCLVVTNGIYVIVFRKTQEYQYLKKIIVSTIKKVIIRSKNHNSSYISN